MAQCVQSVQEFLQDSFVPMVAVLCSKEADRVSRKNKLSFPELLRPFCRLLSEGHIRDPNNQLQTVKNLRICVNAVTTNPVSSPAVLSPAQYRQLGEVVSSCQPLEGAAATSFKTGDYNLNLSVTTPWFEAYRENFLQSMPASEHEFLNHYLACLLVVSSTEAVPVEQFLKLSQEQHRIQHSGEYTHPRWFIPNTLKYYVLLHDLSEGDEQRAETVYEDMKQRYGSQGCYLLKINSRAVSAEEDEQIPDPWSQYLHKNNLRYQVSLVIGSRNIFVFISEGGGESGCLNNDPLQLETDSSSTCLTDADVMKARTDTEGVASVAVGRGSCLTLNDHDRIRQFVQEFTFRGLLPHIEKNIRQLNDQLVSRKGLSRSLFTATKKWFGGGKAPEKGMSEPKSACGLLYPPEAPELQIRKMADLCFLVQHYELAYSCYHTAKKDFLSDQALLYAAGALEMAAVSAFLQGGGARPYPAHYMDTAIQKYRDDCRNMVLAERCALLSAEILKNQAKYSEAATLLIKMTSEDSDLRSALLLEQAAHCFINMRSPMVRKFAFHMILAGHRFSKAGQRKHALRCYSQAMQVYKDRGWSLAEDHINFTIGRQSFTLGQPESAVTAFRQILNDDSKQTATQQAAFLREYLYVHKVSGSLTFTLLPQLPLPCILSAATRVYFGHEPRLAQGEKQAATHVSLDQEYDPELSAMWSRLEEQLVAAANRGIVPVGFQPTQCCLNSQTDNLRQPLAVLKGECSVLPQVLFKMLEQACHDLGETFTSSAPTPPSAEHYSMELVVRGRQDLNIQGPRLNQTKEEKMSVRHGTDRRLDAIITPPMPLMEVFFLHFPSALLCGEIRKAYVEFCNVGAVALCGLRVASTHPEFFTFGCNNPTPSSPASAEHGSAYKTFAATVQPGSVVSEVEVCAQDFTQLSGVLEIPIDGGTLHPGQSIQLPLWLRGPDHEGVHEINFLFYYESTEKGLKVSHRVLRHTVFICASRSLSVQASACRSTAPPQRSADSMGCDGTLVFVDVENVNTSEGGMREFHIVQVSSSSQRWRLHKYINPDKDNDCKLSSREKAKLCFRATPCYLLVFPASMDSVEKYIFADLNLGNEQIISSSTPCRDFFFRCCRGLELQQGDKISRTGSKNKTVSTPDSCTSDPAAIAKKCNELDLTIIVIWKAFVVEDSKQLILEGQLHVALQTIGKEATSLMPKEVDPPPQELPFSLTPHPGWRDLSCSHYCVFVCLSFLLCVSSLCVVPVTLTLSNCCSAPVEVLIDLRHRSTSAESQEFHSLFSWVGQSQYKLLLRPHEVLSLALRACFFRAGVYNLNTARVFAKPAQQSSMSESNQQAASPALIIINST
uniref:Trafficking protein particle complex 8 n=1 Tax=Oryzias latipes TaxID=8090 RepID=A0A3P9HJ53_ORYLA